MVKKVVRFQNQNISYSIGGSGKTVVLLHGFPMDSSIWEKTQLNLHSYYQTIAIDLPGFGESEMLGETHSMSLMAQAVHAVLVNERTKAIVLAGHSMGGYVSLEFAIRYPTFLKGLVLLHSHAAADDDATKENRNISILQIKEDKAAFLDAFVKGLFSKVYTESCTERIEAVKVLCQAQTTEATQAALAGMRDRVDHRDWLKACEVPVLFMLGKEDARIPVEKIMQQATLPAHTEILLLKDVAHFGFLEKPHITGITIGQFAEKCFGLS